MRGTTAGHIQRGGILRSSLVRCSSGSSVCLLSLAALESSHGDQPERGERRRWLSVGWFRSFEAQCFLAKPSICFLSFLSVSKIRLVHKHIFI